MKYIDLTHIFTASIPHSPFDPNPILIQTKTIEDDGYNNSLMTTSMHIGTHIDAPFHMLENGHNISDFSLDKFIGRAKVFNCKGQTVIQLNNEMKNNINEGDMVVLYTGYDQLFNTKEYFTNHPVLSVDLAKHLIQKKIKCLLIDFFSPDKHPYNIHKMLLRNDILIVENIKGASKLLDQDFDIYAIPLKMKTGGSLARVFAQKK